MLIRMAIDVNNLLLFGGSYRNIIESILSNSIVVSFSLILKLRVLFIVVTLSYL